MLLQSRHRIGVVGFGVAGGAISLLLARAGHHVTLLERAPLLGPVGAGFLLQPTGQSVLRRLGLLEEVAERSAVIRGLHARTHSGRTLVDLRYPAPGHAFGVHRAVLFEALRSALEREEVEIRTGVEAAALTGPAGAVMVKTSAAAEHGPFDFIIACDGSRSRLREQICPARRPAEYAFGALWGTGRCGAVCDQVRQAAHGARRLAGLLPVGGGRCTFFWGLHRRELEAIRATPFADWSRQVRALLPEADEPLADLGGHDALVFAGYLHARPARLADARMILLGDAAHPMSPHLGQGANLSLLDAESLARHLATSCDLSAAFRSHLRERRDATRYYALLSGGLSPFFQSESDFLGDLRDLGLPILNAVPWIRRQMELSLAGAKRGFLDQITG